MTLSTNLLVKGLSLRDRRMNKSRRCAQCRCILNSRNRYKICAACRARAWREKSHLF
jgi:hypothetical protein